MKVRRLGQTFFAEVTDVDLARPLDDRTFAEIKKAHEDWLPTYMNAAE